MNKGILFLCFYCWLCICSAQQTALDSLDAILLQDTTDQERKEILLLAARKAVKNDGTVHKVHEYITVLNALPTIAADSTTLMEGLRLDAQANRIMGNYTRSIQQFLGCYHYFKKQNDTANLVFTADQLGAMYAFIGQNEKSQSYLLEVYEIYKAQDNKKGLANATNGLAIFYTNIHQQEKAISQYKESLKLYEELKDTMGRANVHANLGLTYIELGDFTKAEYHIAMQGKLDSLLNTQWGLGFYFDYLGYLREEQGRYEQAYTSYLQSFKIREQLPSQYNLIESRNSMANVLNKLKRYDDAIVQARMVFKDHEERNSLHQQQSAYAALSESYEGKKDFSNALRYHKLVKKISDSIYDKDILETVAEKDALFTKAQKESEIRLLNLQNEASEREIEQKNRTIFFGGIGLFLVCLLCLGLYFMTQKYLRKRRVLAKALSEKDILLREIHHRVKNNLQLVSSLLTLQGHDIENKSVKRAMDESRSRIRSMALIHQELYQKENIMAVNTRKYYKNLCNELFDTYNVSKEQVILNLAIDDLVIDVDTLVPLGLITNELISNSLKYAFPNTKTGNLNVTLQKKRNGLLLSIADNGIGYDLEKEAKNSFGHSLVASLAAQIEGTLEIKIANGTEINLEIAQI